MKENFQFVDHQGKFVRFLVYRAKVVRQASDNA